MSATFLNTSLSRASNSSRETTTANSESGSPRSNARNSLDSTVGLTNQERSNSNKSLSLRIEATKNAGQRFSSVDEIRHAQVVLEDLSAADGDKDPNKEKRKGFLKKLFHTSHDYAEVGNGASSSSSSSASSSSNTSSSKFSLITKIKSRFEKANQFHREFREIFDKHTRSTSPSSFKDLAAALVALLEKYCPEEAANLNKLIAAHKDGYLNQLNAQGGWKKLKAAKGRAFMTTKVNGVSIEEFRGQVVEEVIHLCLAAIKKMGYEDPGKHSATGTPGWDSDIDTPYLAPSGMPQEIQIMEKLMFDAIFYDKFNSSSGILFDTESYIRHAAFAFNTENKIETEEGKANYAKMELNATVMQSLIQYGSPDSPEWIAFKEELFRVATPSLSGALVESIRAVEMIERTIEREINIQIIKDSHFSVPATEDEIKARIASINPSPFQRAQATMKYKTKILLKIAEQMDDCAEEIERLTQKLQKRVGEKRENTIKRIENLHIQVGMLAILRDRFFDEGYISQGAFSKVCLRYQGQMHMHKVREFREKLNLVYNGDGSHYELKYLIAKEIVLKTTDQQNMASSLENLAMYKGHFSHALHANHDPKLKDYQKALVSQSKYSDRILRSNSDVLERVEGSGKAKKEQIEALRKRLDGLQLKAQELEMVKRKSQFNETASNEIFYEILSKIKTERKEPFLRANIKLAVEQMIELERLHFSEESITPQDFCLNQLRILAKLDLISCPAEGFSVDADGFPLSGSTELDKFVQARAGRVLNDDLVYAWHQRAEDLTLASCGFTTIAAIEEFNRAIQDVTMKVYNLGIETGVLKVPATEQDLETSLYPIWEKISAE